MIDGLSSKSVLSPAPSPGGWRKVAASNPSGTVPRVKVTCAPIRVTRGRPWFYCEPSVQITATRSARAEHVFRGWGLGGRVGWVGRSRGVPGRSSRQSVQRMGVVTSVTSIARVRFRCGRWLTRPGSIDDSHRRTSAVAAPSGTVGNPLTCRRRCTWRHSDRMLACWQFIEQGGSSSLH